MKNIMRTQSLMLLLGVLALCLVASGNAWAAGTPAGTVITNQAFGNYNDANGNARPQAASNIVSTTVVQVAAVDVEPETATKNVANGSMVNFPFTVLNGGNGTDSLNVTTTFQAQDGSGTWVKEVYVDINKNGVIDGLDSLLAGGLIPSLPADSTFYGIVKLTTPVQGVNGDSIQVVVKATSVFNNTVFDEATYTAIINAAAMAVDKSNNNQTPKEGQIITYTVALVNTGSDTAYSVVVTDTLPANTTYEVNSNGAGQGSMRRFNGAGAAYADATNQTDGSDGDAMDFNITIPNGVTANLGKVAPGDTVTIYFRVTVDQETPEGTVINNTARVNFKNVNGDDQPEVPEPDPNPPVVDETNAVDLLTVGYADSPDSAAINANPGDTLYYKLRIVNEGNGTDNFLLSAVSSLSDTVLFFADANQDGVPDTTVDILSTGNLTQDQVFNLVACIVIPVGAQDGAQDITIVTATSGDDEEVTDTVKLKSTVTAPLLFLRKLVNNTFLTTPANSDTATTAAPNALQADTLYYTIIVSNLGTGSATSVVITDDGTGQSNNTQYVANSVTIQTGNPNGDGVHKTDVAADDEVVVATGNITVSLGTMAPGAIRTIRFKAIIL